MLRGFRQLRAGRVACNGLAGVDQQFASPRTVELTATQQHPPPRPLPPIFAYAFCEPHVRSSSPGSLTFAAVPSDNHSRLWNPLLTGVPCLFSVVVFLGAWRWPPGRAHFPQGNRRSGLLPFTSAVCSLDKWNGNLSYFLCLSFFLPPPIKANFVLRIAVRRAPRSGIYIFSFFLPAADFGQSLQGIIPPERE